MKLELTVTYLNEDVTSVVCVVPDFVAWERHSKRKISDLSAGIGIEDLSFLAHSALRRREQIKPFDVWVETVSEIELLDADPKAIA